MKSALIASGLVLFLLFAISAPAGAAETLGLYFDRALTQLYSYCPESPPGTVLDTVYLAASGFATPLEGIEYSILFPPEIIWLGDIYPSNGLRLGGNPADGMSVAFFSPLDASDPIILQEFVILWLCQGCPVTNIKIEFAAHPRSGSLRAVTSDLVFEDMVGYTSWVCATYPPSSSMGATANLRATPAGHAAEQCVLDCPFGDGGVILPGDLPGQHHTPDLDHDGVVGIVDFSLFAAAYESVYDPDMDLYCSGNLDLLDFVLFTRHWWHTGTIPVEPSTWGNIKAMFLD